MPQPAHAEPVLGQAHVAALARQYDDRVAGNLILRHTATVRLTHWIVAIFFFLALFTGAVLFTPFLAGLASLLGGGPMVRVLHPWFSLGFVAGIVVLLGSWRKPMRKEPGDEEWRQNFGAYMRYEKELRNVGKYNAGQKIFFWAVLGGAAALLVSGIVMWAPTRFAVELRWVAYGLHEVTFFAFVIAIIYHIYMSTTAMPGTFRAMTRGTVTRAWARWHHPRWYREVTGNNPTSGEKTLRR